MPFSRTIAGDCVVHRHRHPFSTSISVFPKPCGEAENANAGGFHRSDLDSASPFRRDDRSGGHAAAGRGGASRQ